MRSLEDWPDLQRLTFVEGIVYVHQAPPSGPVQAVEAVVIPPEAEDSPVERPAVSYWHGSPPYTTPAPAGYALEFGTGRLMRLQYTPNCTQEFRWRPRRANDQEETEENAEET